MYGYCGKILHADLTHHRFSIEEPDEAFYRLYIGGSCLGSYYLLRKMPAGVDALDPSNVLVFAVSPTTGAPVSGTSRFNVTAKSPLTGAIGDSQAGGFWGTELKNAGFDAIVITGRSPAPVYLWIHDGKFELRDASNAWGKITGEAQAIIREELGDPKARIALIGPAGENLARFACITNELKHYNGRTGMGAVMGSKNLKAIAVRGTNPPQFADKEKITQMARSGAKRSREHPVAKTLREYGTAAVVAGNQAMGGLPTRNWTSGTFEHADSISGAAMTETILQKNEACWACAIRCKRVVEAKEPYEVDPAYGGPEYESIGALGSYLAIGDLVAVSKATELCNKYGLDTISTGGTLAFAMECFENNIITLEDTDGIELNFGNADAALKMIVRIAERKGIGDILAEGSERAAAHFGKGADKYSICCKGQEFPAHMPRVKASLALAYACNPFGADHQSSQHDPAISALPFDEDMATLGFRVPVPSDSLGFEKVRLWAYTQQLFSALDTLELCQFCFGPGLLYGVSDLVELVNAATGWSTTLWELMQVGERRINLMRMFNTREGFTSDDDGLPDRIFERLQGGHTEGNRIDRGEFEEARRQYYEMMGWCPRTGIPTELKLKELALEWTLEAKEDAK
ncbi:MAG: aldehyde ferredoxin oxidoreductase family protein [Firmicutes bacterium]|jgi:aldehyde:ferredoxin oxidoreductase|nr:aldehyde ferredoxin oxidoreductase family protein [Bacillota bacterium]